MSAEESARALMRRMTVAEKIGQLNLEPAGEGLVTGSGRHSSLARRLDQGQVGAIFGTKSLASARALQERALKGSRLEIPLFFAEDVIHGHRTVFPLPVALACSWNMALIEETAAFAAGEASAEGLHQVYAPMIDVSRDPRWGRVAESPGEDPLLAAQYAVAMVQGLQGKDWAGPGRVAACLKHFVAYGATQSGRDYDNASLAWEDLLGVYLPPFEAGVTAGAASLMAAFNAVNKIPMHAHKRLIEGWLRAQQGFDGLVVSDYTGVMELSAHGLGDRATVTARALYAGVDMDMVGEDYLTYLPKLAEAGLDAPEAGVSFTSAAIAEMIDRACLRVLTFKARAGLLDNPFRSLEGRHPAPDRKAGLALARRAAAESAVLLKNGDTLPLKTNSRVALIGPFAKDTANMLGTWAVSGDPSWVRSLHDAMAERPALRLTTARGSDVVDEAWLEKRLNVHGVTISRDGRSAEAMLAEAVAVGRAADLAVVAIGEAKEAAGESSSVLSPVIPAPQARLVDALAEAGVPIVLVIFAGRPLAIDPLAKAARAVLYAWHGGVRGPDGVADILFGDAEPSGRLSATLPFSPGEVPAFSEEEPTGRPYPGHFQKFRTGWLDRPDDALGFPFGFGLGYSTVHYDGPTVVANRITGEQTEVSVTVTNTGARPAVETVQLYLSDPVARITLPMRRLIDFRRITLVPGASETVTFKVPRSALEYWLAHSLDLAEKVWDPGDFTFHTGPNSRDTKAVTLRWEA